MHIKNIIISGFRSYREQAFQEELSPKHNVIVGKNGSGKSNFFAAVQFVLSEKFATLRADERKELFHVGSGRPSLAVFVEIVFDNSDGRIMIPGKPDESEIRIRRTVGLKQDEYRVNDRKFSSSEIRQLLESAGFSASNPYYIVEQGKIIALANMKESDRYQLIKDVAGTKVYESRREESEAILQESASRVDKIDEATKQLDERLAVLEAETSELKSFQEADKKRKALEFCVYNSELNAAKEALQRLDAEWDTKTSTPQPQQHNKEDEVRVAEKHLIDCQKNLDRLDIERKSLEKERKETAGKRAMAQLRVDDFASGAANEALENSDLQKQQRELVKCLEKTKQDLDAKRKLLASHDATTKSALKKLRDVESHLEALQAKRGRKHQFKLRSERDSWLHGEINRNESLQRSNKVEIERLSEETTRIEASVAQLTAAHKSRDVEKHNATSDIATHEAHRSKLLSLRDKLNTDRRKIWAKIQEKESAVRRLTSEHESLRQSSERSCRLDIRQGLMSLEETMSEIGDSKLSAAVHGQLIDLISVEKGFEIAVDVTAGNALFNVVVESFDVSTRLLEHMNKRKKPGRVTFFPLDTCRSLPKDIPKTSTCSSLISHVTCERQFNSVMAEIFGKTAVVSTLESGAAIVREFDVDVVTIDGDQFNRKGGITGGHVERRTNRIGERADLRNVSAQLQIEKDELSALCQKVTAVEQEITNTVFQLEQASSQEAAIRSAADSAQVDARSFEERLHTFAQLREQNEKVKSSLIQTNESLSRTIRALQDELKTDFKSSLSPQEEEELERLQGEAIAGRATTSALQSRLVQLSTEEELLKSQLHHFESSLGAVTDRQAALGRSAKSDSTMFAKELTSLEEELRVIDERISIVEQETEKTALERRRIEEVVSTLRSELVIATKAQQEERDTIERAHNQRVLFLQRKEDAQNKIRKLGVIPTDVDLYSGFSTGKLMHLLKTTHDELKKFAHVNKKAVDQYSSLVETRNDLNDQRDALGKELEGITTLMKHLDEQKDEAIQRTYKQVQFNFEEVFGELVQAEGASAELQLVKNPDRASQDPFCGVRIKVTFGVGNSVSELSQLSGGQKSLVALALIFAIQRCDPAPFYLFDEIDAALDSEYRTAVANVIKKQSETCQFITATFKTEMLEAADQVLGIFFHNKVSHIRQISMTEGQRLLQQAALEERKRGRDDQEQ